jgi:hypothetical protein
MTGHAVTGDLQLMPDGSLEGWVWSRDRPDQRLVAELDINDVPVGAIVAELFRRDLLGQGIGDGRHGFRLQLPPGSIPSEGRVTITGREQQSNQLFARIVRGRAALAPKHRAAIETAAGQLRELRSRLETLLAERPVANKSGQVRAAFGGLSSLLAVPASCPGGATAAAVALERLRRGAGRPELPRCSQPALSIVLPAGPDVPATLRRLRALAPALAAAGAELVLLDDGADPATALLPALVPNLAYRRAGIPGEAARNLCEAVRTARGSHVAVLDATPAEPSASALLALARHMADAPRRVVLGEAALAACARVGAPAPVAACAAPARLGLRFALARDLLVQAGGLEPAMVDGDALESVDLWRRCRLLGAEALAWREPARAPGEVPARRDHPRAALLALAAYRHRWPATITIE